MVNIIISILILTGAFFVFVAAVGILRFKDLYGRLHATTKATSFGMMLLLAGVSLFFNITPVYVKSLLIIHFIYLTAPLAAHSIAKTFLGEDKNSDSKSDYE